MDGRTFDDLLRSLTQSRRSLLGGLLGAAPAWGLRPGAAVAKHKKHKGKHKPKQPPTESCGAASCAGHFCCDDQRGICCQTSAECCNPGAGTGSCCAAPNHCAPIF